MLPPTSPPTPPPPLGSSDAELVRACAGANGATAFAELVRRHGRAVLAVCRGILGDGADTDDAFQATFLVLWKRAAAVRQPEAVGGWLCGVAAKVARRARQRRTGTWAKEVAMTPNATPDAAATDPAAVALDRDSRAAVWAELGELPDKYRQALVLCHLQEHTTEQAAAVLRCPVGTLRSRLVKGRELLRARLVRRGVTVTAAALVALFLAGTAAACPPSELVTRTTAAAATGGSPAVERLADQTAREMSPSRWPVVLAAAVALAVAGLFVAFGWPNAVPPEPPPVTQRPAGPGTLLVVSQQDAHVALLDPSTGRTRAVVRTDPCPHEVAVSPSGRLAAVANYGLPFGLALGGTVTLIDVASGTKLRTVDVGAASAPHGLFWLSDERLLCTAEGREAVVEIDVPQGKVARTLRTAQAGTHMVVAAGGRAYTANSISNSVTGLDLTAGQAVADRRVGRQPEGIAVSPDGKRVWVGNRLDDTVSVLDGGDLKEVKTLPVQGMPIRLAFTPDGTSVAVVAHLTDELVLFDAATLAETKRFKLSDRPVAVAFTPDGRTAFCTAFAANSVFVIDLTAGEVTGKFAVPGGAPDGLAFSPISPDEDQP